MIRDIVTLDADPELFLDKVLDDIRFADGALGVLLGYLEDNQRLIGLDELLEHFSEAEWRFSAVLKDILDHNGNFSVRDNPLISEKLNVYRNSSMERRRIADNLNSQGDGFQGSPIVSSDELTELLKAL